jgi:hypothetical protein
MPPVGSEPTIPASERPHTLTLDCAVSEIGISLLNFMNFASFEILRVKWDSINAFVSQYSRVA